MTSNKMGIALVVWLIGVGVMGGYYHYSPEIASSGSSNSSLDKQISQPFIREVVLDSPVVLPYEELGLPSTGTTHIYQTVIEEGDNPYSMTDAESVANFNASLEGQFIQTLFSRLNSTEDALFTQNLANLTENDLSTAIQISPALQRMFYGYRPSDNPQHFLFDSNLMHQFQPHATLLKYIQSVRPDGTYYAQMRGSVLPNITNEIPIRVKVTFGDRDIDYLVRQSAGTCIIESIGPETRYFKVSFRFNLGIPHDVQAEGYPLLLWSGGIQITLVPMEVTTWEEDKKAYFVRG